MTSHPRVHEWQKLLLRPDIANCLAFSKLRCLISIISLLLLATDIPRSGLGVRRLDQFYAARLKPDTAVRFGPFDYPVRHIWRSKNAESNDADSFRGLEGSDLVDSANVWSYKYDTTSVGLRGAVELLNVTGYPGYLLYRGDVGKKNNHRATLALNTTFLMLDAFITTAQTRVQPESNVGTSWRTFRFATKHIWVDRAYQYLTQFIKRIKLWSLHSLHVLRVSHPTNSLRICIKDLPHPQLQPRFCTYSGIWECENPLNASLPPVRISEQMDIRFRDLQRRYPDLTLDVAILSTHRPSMTSGTLSFTFFNCEEQEIVVLTRGRRCSKNETRHTTLEDDECTTVFVDDYRYERNILQTNVADWYFFIAAMRAAAQGYFWARLILLYHTAFLATKELGKDKQHWYTRVVSAILVVFKIPFQVIVYSSLLPVVGYVLALLLDGNFMDIFLDSYWSTLEGASNFEIMSFLKSAMTQMRTVWLMALLVDLMVFVTRKRINGSEEKIPGIRGLAISFTSALTVIGPYRQTTFRNTELVKAIRLPDIGQRMDTVQSTPQWFFNESTYMFDGSMTMLIVCIGAVVIITSAVRIHRRAPAWSDKAPASAVATSDNNHSTRTLTLERTKAWHEFLPQPHIPKCIALSKLRLIFTMVSFALLITDIPRTGLGIWSLQEYYPIALMPSTAVRFGPFHYPVVHIQRLNNDTESDNTSSAFVGLKDSQPISTARAWPYQFDTLSVGLRGAVELLNVTEFPRYLRYKPQEDEPTTNGESLVDLSTAFTMLDALIAAAHAKLRPESSTKSKTLRYATKHNWVDRIHHYVVRFASTNPAWRLHSLHVPRFSRDTQSLGICSNSAVLRRSSLRPRFCNHPGILKYSNPLNASLPAVRVWDHIDLRHEMLQQRYPSLELEVIVVSSQRLSSTSGVLSSTFYNYEAIEITVLTRGKRCINASTSGLNTTTCTTVFVDDYRYERDTVRTNLVEWYGIISLLRGGAQGYVWIRLVLLIYGAYTAAGQLAGVKARTHSHFKSTLSIVLKIPFEVIVYSSLLPVSGYVIAQLLDSSFMDIFLDSYWAAVGGTIKINLLTFLKSTAVQMRNVWILALLVTLTVFAVRKTRDYWGGGLPAIRGLVISFTSTLTVFGPYKETTLRDTDIIDLFLITDEGQRMDTIQSNLVGKYNVSTYFFDDSAVMLLFCIGVVFGLATMVKVLDASRNKGETRDIILSSTPTIPCGTQRLWLASVLSVQFFVRISDRAPNRQKKVFLVTKVSPFHTVVQPNLKSTDRRNLLGKASYNSAECRSVVQLMNIAMMTDPWNFFWLRVLGVQLYLYKTRSGLDNSFVSYAVILPFAQDEVEERTGLSSNDIQLLDSASSRDVPMSVLLQSG
ncbi:hypothetical protein PC111_g2664 [Phytophthora cactorum]|nr:hypothetical protein PC111_g2664 [Phytophthora cactorum]